LRQIVIDTPVSRAIGLGQGTMGEARSKSHVVELIGPRAQADSEILSRRRFIEGVESG